MNLKTLSSYAWDARQHARLMNRETGTAVGCAVMSGTASAITSGCNIEHRFRSHDIHAEVSALSSAAAFGLKSCTVLIAAERELFTPCGSCLDWIFELGGPQTRVIHEKAPGVVTIDTTARELMPFYPF